MSVTRAYVEQLADALLNRCDRLGLICDIRILVRQPDGKRLVALDAHGKHELAAKTSDEDFWDDWPR